MLRKWLTSDFLLKTGLGEEVEPSEQLQRVHETVRICVPQIEDPCFFYVEDLLELAFVDREVAADALERAMVLSQL